MHAVTRCITEPIIPMTCCLNCACFPPFRLNNTAQEARVKTVQKRSRYTVTNILHNDTKIQHRPPKHYILNETLPNSQNTVVLVVNGVCYCVCIMAHVCANSDVVVRVAALVCAVN